MTNERRQRLLCLLADDNGRYYYNGPIDGLWGPESQDAYERFLGDFLTADMEDKPTETGTFWDEIEFFDHDEFRCTCGGRGCNGFPAEPVEQLIRNAEATRKHFGKVADVSSGVRCELRNSELPGSASNSLHMRGKAMDFRIRGVSSATTLAFVKTLPNVNEAYAIDDSYVHMGVLKYS